MYIVICREDDGNYTFATRRVFEERERAENYASGIAIIRQPLVVEVPYGFLYPP